MTYLWFEVLLGLKITLKKCELILVGMVPDVELLDELGVEECFRKRMALWRRLYISKGGQSCLSSALYPTCLFILFPFHLCQDGLYNRLKETSYEVEVSRKETTFSELANNMHGQKWWGLGSEKAF